jgi:protein involved in polysaccharide export with SLBB domain
VIGPPEARKRAKLKGIMPRLFDGDVLTNFEPTEKHRTVRARAKAPRRASRRTATFIGAWLGAVAVLGVAGPTHAQTAGDEAARILTEGASGTSARDLRAVTPPGTTPRPTLAGPVDPASYRLGPGDVLGLEYGGKALDSKTLVVDGEGLVRVPNLGLVKVGGTTLADARADIVKRLRPYLPGATVDLRLLQPRTFKVYVLGEVKSGSVQEVTGSARVSEAIDAAGGTNPSASRRNIRVVHRDGRIEIADLERFERTGDWEANPYLADGDRVIVPVTIERFGIFGAVAQPNFYDFREGDSLNTALRLAGGLRPEARLDSVLIIRFRGAHQLDTLYASIEPGSGREAIAIRADDRVFVRPQPDWKQGRQVTIAGEVNAPGVYAIEEGKSRVSDLVRWAGSFTPQAAPRNVHLERNVAASGTDVEFERLSRLSRSEMTNSEYQTFRSKLALRQSSYLVDFSTGVPQPAEADVPLRDGDRISVPRLELVVRVDGSVKNPGLVTYKGEWSASDYIEMAGGPTRRANVGDARVSRSGSSNTMFARDAHRIEPGDFIWVPEKKDTSFWIVFRDAVIVTGQVATVILVIDQLSK